MLLTLLVACGGSLKIETVEDIRDACENNEPEDIELSVTFTALNEGCPFGEGDNLEAQDAFFSARIEQDESLEIPEGGVMCGMEFDFAGPDGGQGQSMLYDDNFLLALNDVVLATSYAPFIAELEAVDGLPLYDWADVAGLPLEFTGVPSWCLGEGEGDSSCTVPPPETEGTLELSFGGELVDQLALRAVQEQAYSFSFATFGDNDDTDCSHAEFTFTVIAPVVSP